MPSPWTPGKADDDTRWRMPRTAAGGRRGPGPNIIDDFVHRPWPGHFRATNGVNKHEEKKEAPSLLARAIRFSRWKPLSSWPFSRARGACKLWRIQPSTSCTNHVTVCIIHIDGSGRRIATNGSVPFFENARHLFLFFIEARTSACDSCIY